jgi:hypothetical protein
MGLLTYEWRMREYWLLRRTHAFEGVAGTRNRRDEVVTLVAGTVQRTRLVPSEDFSQARDPLTPVHLTVIADNIAPATIRDQCRRRTSYASQRSIASS